MKLSENFTTDEFVCKCGCDTVRVDLRIVDALEKLRAAISDIPIEVLSGYRCPTHNKAVGGVENSPHKRGMAADIRVFGMPAVDLYRKARDLGIFTGIGLSVEGNYVHVDVMDRPVPLVCWGYKNHQIVPITEVLA